MNQNDEQNEQEEASIGSDHVTAEALRLAQKLANDEAERNHRELTARFANEINNLRRAGKATKEALVEIREQYAAQGMGYLIAPPTIKAVGDALVQASNTVKSGQLVESYRSDLMAARGNPDKVRQVKASYAAKGLDVDRTPIFPGVR